MNIISYSEKSFVVTGETKENKEELKKLGGKWNSNLSCGGGWIFSNKSRTEVEKFIESGSFVKDEVEPEPKIVSLMRHNQRQSTPQPPTLFSKFVEFLKNEKVGEDVIIEYMYRAKTEDLKPLQAETLFVNFICICKPTFEEYLKLKKDKESFIELALCHAYDS